MMQSDAKRCKVMLRGAVVKDERVIMKRYFGEEEGN